MKVKMAQNSYRTTTQQISIQTKPKQRLGGHSVAHVILVSAQVLLVLTLGLRTLDFGFGLWIWTLDFGLTITFISFCLGFQSLQSL